MMCTKLNNGHPKHAVVILGTWEYYLFLPKGGSADVLKDSEMERILSGVSWVGPICNCLCAYQRAI